MIRAVNNKSYHAERARHQTSLGRAVHDTSKHNREKSKFNAQVQAGTVRHGWPHRCNVSNAREGKADPPMSSSMKFLAASFDLTVMPISFFCMRSASVFDIPLAGAPSPSAMSTSSSSDDTASECWCTHTRQLLWYLAAAAQRSETKISQEA